MKKINTPTLILPKVWNQLANEIKRHSHKKEVVDYDDFMTMEGGDLKGIYKSALYGNFWVKRRELLRAIPIISGTTLER